MNRNKTIIRFALIVFVHSIFGFLLALCYPYNAPFYSFVSLLFFILSLYYLIITISILSGKRWGGAIAVAFIQGTISTFISVSFYNFIEGKKLKVHYGYIEGDYIYGWGLPILMVFLFYIVGFNINVIDISNYRGDGEITIDGKGTIGGGYKISLDDLSIKNPVDHNYMIRCLPVSNKKAFLIIKVDDKDIKSFNKLKHQYTMEVVVRDVKRSIININKKKLSDLGRFYKLNNDKGNFFYNDWLGLQDIIISNCKLNKESFVSVILHSDNVISKNINIKMYLELI